MSPFLSPTLPLEAYPQADKGSLDQVEWEGEWDKRIGWRFWAGVLAFIQDFCKSLAKRPGRVGERILRTRWLPIYIETLVF